ncbi:hypothetical protein GE061_008245 [Apolygus lucorum]|uniref:Uncharacterized protein n=1 Tax=Apolygus lucorum TaxID=248454 RepID=A0A6A4J0X4_APOLU|nr:hypothetical protein GE061_008245 [Apolygus lucorum]
MSVIHIVIDKLIRISNSIVMNVYNYVGLKKWQLFANSDVNILAQITLCHVFSETRTQLGVIYIDHKDQVYGKGYNGKFNKLGIPNQNINRTYQYRNQGQGEIVEGAVLIPELSGENISSILTGYRYGAAMSKTGKVFFWGLDLSSEDYSASKVTQAPKLLNNGKLMNGELARQITCSGCALGIITRSGKLLVWGLWTGPDSTIMLNQEVVMDAEPKSIVGGGWHFAVTSLYHHLFTFGDGSLGQLGYEWDPAKDSYTRPKRVSLPEPVMSVACSQLATLVFLQPWALYIFGENTNGRLGVESKKDILSTPTRINLSEPIQYVLASIYDSVFYAVTSTPKRLYRWGYDASLVKPQSMEVLTTIEAFANRAIPVCDMLPDSDSVSAPTLIPEMNSTGQLNELCDQELFSDVTLKLQDGEFKGHRSILYSRSEHFKSLLQPCWAEGQSQVVDMTYYDAKAYRAYLNYVYRGSVESLEPYSLVQLYMIADEYLDPKLKEYCYTKFKSLIKVESVGELYRAAEANSCEALAAECYHYTTQNITALESHLKAVNLQVYLQTLLAIE